MGLFTNALQLLADFAGAHGLSRLDNIPQGAAPKRLSYVSLKAFRALYPYCCRVLVNALVH
jgi:hypothetical protein